MITLLRTLTKKSYLKFGRYYDMRVGDLLTSQQHRILRFYYFNCDKITFVDEILDEINIPKDFRIEKPGKNPELNFQLNEIHNSTMPYKSKIHFEKKKKYSNIAEHRKIKHREARSKGGLRDANQGKRNF